MRLHRAATSVASYGESQAARPSAMIEVTSARSMAGERVVRKNVPSAFFGTDLAPRLTQRGVRTLLVAGCVTSGCVRASVVDAMCWGFRPVVMEGCVGDRALGPHEASLFDMRQKYADVVCLEELYAQLPG